MSQQQTKLELAIEVLERNGRCAHIPVASPSGCGEWVCTRIKNHPGEHQCEEVSRIIPFE